MSYFIPQILSKCPIAFTSDFCCQISTHFTVKIAKSAAVIVMQIKPMQVIDVRPHNTLLHQYLKDCGESGHGALTQIRMEHLRKDGYHIYPLFDSVLDRGYACALLGVPFPCPTPYYNFVPYFVRRRCEQEWPRLVNRGSRASGWGP